MTHARSVLLAICAAFVLLLGAISQTSPASAAGDCAVIKKSILTEENLGFAAWQKFSSYQKRLPKKLQVKNLREYVRLIQPVHASDLRALAMISNNPACFDSKLLASVKKETTSTKDSVKAFNDMIVNISKLADDYVLPNSDQIYPILSKYYNEFWEIIENKRMSAAVPVGSSAPNKNSGKSPSASPSSSPSSSSIGSLKV